jgi:transcriptional regulator with XRE-family HTH domain
MNTAGPGGEQLFSGLDPSVDATVLRMLLGSQLQRLREAAGITPEQAGYEIRASRSKISRLENGRVGLKSRDTADLLTLYGVTDEALRSRFLALVKQANTPDSSPAPSTWTSARTSSSTWRSWTSSAAKP